MRNLDLQLCDCSCSFHAQKVPYPFVFTMPIVRIPLIFNSWYIVKLSNRIGDSRTIKIAAFRFRFCSLDYKISVNCISSWIWNMYIVSTILFCVTDTYNYFPVSLSFTIVRAVFNCLCRIKPVLNGTSRGSDLFLLFEVFSVDSILLWMMSGIETCLLFAWPLHTFHY